MNNFSEIQTFNFSEAEVRIILTPTGDVYFVAPDVCKVLELEQVSNALKRLDKDEVISINLTDSLGRLQNTNAITESGLYSLVLSSKKPSAKAFKKWVTSEVLPAIRKTGTYSLPNISIGITRSEVLDLMNDYMTKNQIEKRLDTLIIDVNKGIEASLKKFYEGLNKCHFDEIETRLEKLEEINFPTLGIATAFVYITQEGISDAYKIGQSTQPVMRAEKLNIGNSQKLTLVWQIPFKNTDYAKTFEDFLKVFFMAQHIRGEWYKLTYRDFEYIQRLAEIQTTHLENMLNE